MVDAGEYMVQCLCWYEDEEKGIWMIKWMKKMDDGYGLVLYAFPAHFRDLSPVSI